MPWGEVGGFRIGRAMGAPLEVHGGLRVTVPFGGPRRASPLRPGAWPRASSGMAPVVGPWTTVRRRQGGGRGGGNGGLARGPVLYHSSTAREGLRHPWSPHPSSPPPPPKPSAPPSLPALGGGRGTGGPAGRAAPPGWPEGRGEPWDGGTGVTPRTSPTTSKLCDNEVQGPSGWGTALPEVGRAKPPTGCKKRGGLASRRTRALSVPRLRCNRRPESQIRGEGKFSAPQLFNLLVPAKSHTGHYPPPSAEATQRARESQSWRATSMAGEGAAWPASHSASVIRCPSMLSRSRPLPRALEGGGGAALGEGGGRGGRADQSGEGGGRRGGLPGGLGEGQLVLVPAVPGGCPPLTGGGG